MHEYTLSERIALIIDAMFGIVGACAVWLSAQAVLLVLWPFRSKK